MKTIHLFILFMFTVASLAMTGCSKGEYGNKDKNPVATNIAGSVTILSPKNGAVLNSGSGDKLTYDVHLSPKGNHLHIYVDNRSPIIDRNVSGCPCSVTLPDMSPGSHEVAVKEATVNHVLTGVGSTVSFSVK